MKKNNMRIFGVSPLFKLHKTTLEQKLNGKKKKEMWDAYLLLVEAVLLCCLVSSLNGGSAFDGLEK